jgi:formate dehydrogenase subunit gamma
MDAATTPRPEPSGGVTAGGVAAPDVVDRFDVVERVVHWATAALVIVMLLTGSVFYFGPLSGFIGRRELIRTIHVWCGIAMLVPLVIAVLLRRRGRRLRADLGRLGRWSRDDGAWLRRLGRPPSPPPSGKFNGGQKAFAAIVAGGLPLMVVSGLIMRFYKPFPLDWRTGATFVHDWVYLLLGALILVHIGKALGDRELLQSMRTGKVSRWWAERERPRWRPEDPA